MLFHSRKNFISPSYTDPQARLSVVGAATLMQDIAAEHSEKMNVGFKRLYTEYGAFWVVARTKFKLLRPVMMYEDILSQTWPSKSAGAICQRNYLFTDKDNKPVLVGKNEWVVLDSSTRRIRRLSTIDYPDSDEFLSDVSLEEPFSRFSALPGEDCLCFKHTVRSGEIDQAHHTNNIFYIRFFLNALSADYLDTHFITDFEIKYVKETSEGDELFVYKMPLEDGFELFAAKEDGELIACAKLSAQKSHKKIDMKI